jgi:hypothetical protein
MEVITSTFQPHPAIIVPIAAINHSGELNPMILTE